MHTRLPLILCLLGVAAPAWCIDVSLVGSWTELIDANDLVSGAGSNLAGTYQSTIDETSLTVFNTTGDGDNWRLDVRRTDTNWPAGFTLWVKRTSAGTGTGSISGGTTYQQVTTTDTSFFIGAGDRNGVDVRLKLMGVSVGQTPDNYLASVVYTVVDTP